MGVPAADSAETERLLDRIRAGEKPAVDRLFDRHRPYLRRVVELRPEWTQYCPLSHRSEPGQLREPRDLPLPDRSSILLAREFISAGLSPSQHLLRSEFIRRVREAVGRLPEGDREVLILRKLEGLSNQETAHLLDIDPATASRRFGRAVLRLRDILIQAGLMEAEP